MSWFRGPIQDETSMQFYFSIEGLVGNDQKTQNTTITGTPYWAELFSVQLYLLSEEFAPVSAFKHFSQCNQIVSSLRHHSTQFPQRLRVAGTLQDINYWDKCQDLTFPKDILKSKADEVNFPRPQEPPPWSEQSVGSPLVQQSSFSAYTPFKYPFFKNNFFPVSSSWLSSGSFGGTAPEMNCRAMGTVIYHIPFTTDHSLPTPFFPGTLTPKLMVK